MLKNIDLTSLFKSILNNNQILNEESDLKFYGNDWCKEFSGEAGLVLLPENTTQISEILKICSANNISVIPSGGRTGLSGGATALNKEVVISLQKMNKIIEVDPISMTMRVQAGATTQAVIDAAAEHNLYYPVQFGSRGSSQIGGNLATNAGGVRVIKYGATRDWVVGLTAVLSSGEILVCNDALVKNQTGYDFRHLLIGSEGTLGIISEVVLRLTYPPSESTLFLAGISSLNDTHRVLKKLRSTRTVISLFEYFDLVGMEYVTAKNNLKNPFQKNYPFYLLGDLEGEREQIVEELSNILDDKLVEDIVIAENLTQRQELISLRERIGETFVNFAVPHKNDLSVPVSKVPEFVEGLITLLTNKYPYFIFSTFGHIGDGNIHVNILKPNDLASDDFFKLCHEADKDLFDLVASFAGSISAEHGIGILKRDFLNISRTLTDINLMKSIKHIFDKYGIMNPGKVFK